MSRALRLSGMRLAVCAAVVALLALAVAWPNWSLRQEMRAQVLTREGRTLLALVDLQRTLELDRLGELQVVPEAFDELEVALQTTRLAGVIALRLHFESDGELVAFPTGVTEVPLDAADRARAGRRDPVVRFHPGFSLLTLYDQKPEAGEATADCVEIIVPISPPGAPLVAAQYWIDARALSAEYAALDRGILVRALAVWAVASLLALLLLVWAGRRIAASARALERANQELQLAAKSSALGAVTAHLMHGLRNPLAGLRGLARDRSREANLPSGEGAWSEAVQLTDRLHAMVQEVTELLRDEAHDLRYAVTAAELKELVRGRVQAQLARTGVSLHWQLAEPPALDSRRAGLVSLVLANLVQNACEVTAAGAAVEVGWKFADGSHCFEVRDRGPGLPAAVRERLFLPVASSRAEGAGIGLAISRQLAAHAGGELSLARSDATGTVFRLVLPAEAPPADAV